MHATLDPVAKSLTNDEVIAYTNSSPDTLTALWLHLDQTHSLVQSGLSS